MNGSYNNAYKIILGNLEKKKPCADPAMYGRTVLKLILKKQNVRV
jgi:hypothetical protein